MVQAVRELDGDDQPTGICSRRRVGRPGGIQFVVQVFGRIGVPELRDDILVVRTASCCNCDVIIVADIVPVQLDILEGQLPFPAGHHLYTRNTPR